MNCCHGIGASKSGLSRRIKQFDEELLALGEDSMLLEELDGFIAGLLACPELIMPSDWLPVVWRENTADQQPVFENLANARFLTIKQVRSDNLVIIIGCVRKGAAPIAIAERPNAGDVGLKAFVHHDIAARIERDPGALESEIVGVGPPAEGEHHVGGQDLRVTMQ